MKVIVNAKIVLFDRVIEKNILVFDENITNILPVNDIRFYKKVEVIDAQGGYLAPGLINIHIHGFNGRDTMEASYEALDSISRSLLKTGVTGFLPTTMSMDILSIQKALLNIIECKHRGVSGSRILGINVEGPFINSKFKGAQAEEYIIEPNIEILLDYLEDIKMITIAPEIRNSEVFIKKMREKNIIVSVGHSAATYEEILKAKKWGLSHSTHLFNAMSGLHHRKPGIVGAVLTSNMTCELIADFIHLHPAILKLVTQIKDVRDIILITDSMEAGGLIDGEYSLGGQKVIVKNGAARLENGALAGSTLSLSIAIRNMIDATGLPVNEIINMATLNPAQLLHIDHRVGKIEKDMQADLTLFDEKFEVKKVFIRGKEMSLIDK